jgi:hypothetical protein
VDDFEPTWQRQLLVGLGVLLVIGAVVGVIVAGIAVRAADYLGVGDHHSSTPALVLPSTGNATHTASSPPPPSSHPPPAPTITLSMSPTSVAASQRVNISGHYPGGDGSTLQVQRALGSGPWADFPVTTHVTGDSYATYIETSYTGINHFRMRDAATGKTSNVVTVTIH